MIPLTDTVRHKLAAVRAMMMWTGRPMGGQRTEMVTDVTGTGNGIAQTGTLVREKDMMIHIGELFPKSNMHGWHASRPPTPAQTRLLDCIDTISIIL
jgi:hypothetical protein